MQPYEAAEPCVFCEIARGTAPAHVFWESDRHMAFLSIYPNSLGVTVVIPKLHFCSYAFAQNDEVLTGLVLAAKKVAGLLDAALPDVGRTAMIFEGYGVDHLHAKLFPLRGTGNGSEFKKISSSVGKYFHCYEGYVSSHDWLRADDQQLAMLAQILASHGAVVGE